MSLTEIATALGSAQRVALMGHHGGDSDCFGAMFGLKLGLESLGKQVEIISPEDFPESLSYLFYYFPGSVDTKYVPNRDLLMLVDTSEVNRLEAPEIFTKYKDEGVGLALLDHHVHGGLQEIVDYAHVDTAVSSTSELAYQLLSELKVNIDKNMATCLLAGIIGDTSSFQNQNTTEASFAVASELMRKGARLNNIVSNTFGGKDVDVLKIWGIAMDRLWFDKKYGIVTTYLTLGDIKGFGLSSEAVKGIINYLNSIKGAKIVMLITEEEEGVIKVSLRTRDEHVNVAELAKNFGGGGHVKAAGFSFPGSLKTLTEGVNNHIVIV